MKDKGVGVNMDSEMFSAVWAGGRAVEGVVVASASSRRSLFARWRAFFSAEAAGMVAVLETGARSQKRALFFRKVG